MAHVPLLPIGSALVEPGESPFGTALVEREAELCRRRAAIEQGWGDKYVKRVHAKGKLTARERIEHLKDTESPALEVGTFVNLGRRFENDVEAPGAGVVTVFVRVAERWCVVIANDNTVASGSWWPLTPEKIQRAQTMAMRLRLPVIYLVDSSGLFLPEQAKSFPGARGAGHIFKMNSLLSAHGVPQIAGVFGDCIAGGGYMPIISDRVYMTEQAYMVIAGAALIRGAKSQNLTSLDIGGPEVHVHASGCADVRVPDDETLLLNIRRDAAALPSSAAPFYRAQAGSIPPRFPPSQIGQVLPADHREAYDAEQLLARLCDQSLFWEVLAGVGPEILCGVARFGGLYAGLVMNRQGLVDDATRPGDKRPGSILYREGIAKLSAFSRACNDDGLPILWLQDVAGFDIGAEAERQGLLAYGSSLIYTNSTNETPMFSVLLRKAAGAGYYAMSGLPYDPVVQLSTVFSRLAVMEGRTLAIAAYNTKLDENFEVASNDPAERDKTVAGMRAVEERIERDMDPYAAASQMDTDEIVEVGALRDWLVALVEMSYQAIGYRRIKNPRIWSLHDLDLIGSFGPGVGSRATPQAGVAVEEPSRAEANPVASAGDPLAYRAPSSGRFFGRPAPDQPPFLETGQVVVRGQTVGLLEVMKTYTRLQFGGAGLPQEARVLEVVPEDGADLAVGDVILRLADGG